MALFDSVYCRRIISIIPSPSGMVCLSGVLKNVMSNFRRLKVDTCCFTAEYTALRRPTQDWAESEVRIVSPRWMCLVAASVKLQVAYSVLKLGVQCHWMGYNCCFFLNFVPLHIESPYNFGGTGPILGVTNPLQRVNGHAEAGVKINLVHCSSVLHAQIRYINS